jgi:glycerophosphoryl diester phosphodiesterase
MRAFKLTNLVLLLLFASSIVFAQKSNLEYIKKEFFNPESKTILVAAHRGAHIGNCENSVLSTKRSIEIGVDIIELDVQVTKDGVVVLMHDRTIDRVTNGTGRVSDYTFAELQKFRLKSWLGIQTDEKIPTFEEILNIAKGKILIDIDLKTENVDPVVAVVQKTATEDQVFFFSKNYDLLKHIRTMDKRAMFMPRAYNYKMAVKALDIFNPPVVHVDPSFYSEKLGKLIRENRSRIWINALGEVDATMRYGHMEEKLEELTRYGANVIQTNEPAMFLEYLRVTGNHK